MPYKYLGARRYGRVGPGDHWTISFGAERVRVPRLMGHGLRGSCAMLPRGPAGALAGSWPILRRCVGRVAGIAGLLSGTGSGSRAEEAALVRTGFCGLCLREPRRHGALPWRPP